MAEPAKETGKFVVNGIELDHEDTRKAKVLYDYEADNESELTVYCDQVSKRVHTLVMNSPPCQVSIIK